MKSSGILVRILFVILVVTLVITLIGLINPIMITHIPMPMPRIRSTRSTLFKDLDAVNGKFTSLKKK